MAVTFEFYQRALDVLRHRSFHYRRVFDPNNGDAKAVLADLARFCHANETVFNQDQRMTDVLIGRNEVLLRILRHLKLQPTDLYAILDGREVLQPTTAPTEGHAE